MNVQATDLNLFVVLDALLETRSVTKAARRIGLSQPATSNALARLRALFDDPLFVRRGAAMLPTPRAEQVASHVRAALGHLGAALGPPRGFDPVTARRSFVLAANDFAAFAVLPELMRIVGAEAPGVTLRIVGYGAEQPFAALESAAVDLALGAAKELPSGIASEAYADIDFAVAVRADHPRIRRRLTLRQYLEVDHLLVAPMGGLRGVVDQSLQTRGLSRRIALSVPNVLLAPQIVSQTDLVVTLARRVLESLGPPLGLRLFAPPLPVNGLPYSGMWDARREDDPAHRWLRETVRRALRG